MKKRGLHSGPSQGTAHHEAPRAPAPILGETLPTPVTNMDYLQNESIIAAILASGALDKESTPRHAVQMYRRILAEIRQTGGPHDQAPPPDTKMGLETKPLAAEPEALA